MTDGHSKVVADAGADVLHKFEKNWSQLHAMSEENSAKIDQVSALYSSILSQTVKYHSALQSFESMMGDKGVFNEITSVIACIEDDLKNASSLLEQLETMLALKEEEAFQGEMKKKFDVTYYLKIYEEQQIRSIKEMEKMLRTEAEKKEHERNRLEHLNAMRRQEMYQREFEEQLKLYRENGQTNQPDAGMEASSIALEDISIEPDEKDKSELEEFLKEE